MQEELAIIDEVFIGLEDHGILTLTLTCKGAESGWVQGYGTFGYGSYSMDDERSQWTEAEKARAGLALTRTIIALCQGFKQWDLSRLKGTHVWVQRGKDYGTIEAIRPLGGKAINFRELFPPFPPLEG